MIQGLLAARTKLQADTALSAFFVARYGRDARHVVGDKLATNAADLPQICYVPVFSTDPDQIGGMSHERVSIVISVNEPNMTDDIYDGIVQSVEAERLVKAAMDNGELGNGAMYLKESKTFYGSKHPFYDVEISILLGAR